jgi:undecaprenyl-diphosphatase
VPAVLIVAALIIGCLLARRWRLAAVAAIGPLSAVGTTTALKPLVERTIHGSTLAFPSGHTAFATAAALLLGLLVIGVFRPGRAVGGAVLAVLALVAGAVMAVDQIVLDAHYPTDTVGGFFTAITVVLVVALLADVLGGLPRRDRGMR